MNASAQPPVREGDMLAGKYRVEKILGQGGMGVVVAAYHIALNQRVAVKFLLGDAVENQQSVQRFLREARAAVQIQSEHVARVIDVGTLENGAPYMVMEYLQGQDLSQVLAERGPLYIDEACEYVIQACSAIAEAHALGIVHRDLKPANLFMTTRPDGSPLVKVLDFGISKAKSGDVGTGSGAVTATGMIFGSPLYMSPEQMKSAKDVDHRTDIWALGVILFELLTRTELFIADTLPGIVARIVAEPPTPLRQIRADAPAELEALLQRTLEKNRDMRTTDVAELAVGLLPFTRPENRTLVERIVRTLRGAQATISVMPPPNVAAMSPGAQTYGGRPGQFGRAQTGAHPTATNAAWGTTNSGAQQKNSKAPLILAGAALLVAIIGVVAVFATRGGKQPEKGAATEQAQKPIDPASKPSEKKPDDPVVVAPPEPAPKPEATAAPAPTVAATTAPKTPTTVAAAKTSAAVAPTSTSKPAAIAATAKPTATSKASVLEDRK